MVDGRYKIMAKMPDKTLHQVWLVGLAKLAKRDFLPEYDLGTVASYGFPTSHNADSVRGCCYFPKNSDGHKVILIHPSEWIGDGTRVVVTFLHEAVHSVLPEDAAHGARFISTANKIGLKGDLCDTPDATLSDWIQGALAMLPPLPSDPLGRDAPPPPQKGRMSGWICSCGVKVRYGRKDSFQAKCLLCGSVFEPYSKGEKK